MKFYDIYKYCQKIWFETIASLIVCLLVVKSPQARADTSVSQYGITWRFLEDKEVGRFANGDYWVVGPVTITSITPVDPNPADSNDESGTMINPVPNKSQGLCTFSPPGYDRSKNIARSLPQVINPGSSVYSSRAQTVWDGNKTMFTETAVLTVVDSPPPAGSFRPPYAGTDKKIRWNVSQMDSGALRSLKAPIPSNVPNREWLENATVRPLIEMISTYQNSTFKASNLDAYPRRTYGREISNISIAAGLYLNLDVPIEQKRTLMINMCQWGIDIHGLINSGMTWNADGGHNHGRKLPLFIAARILGDQAMLDQCDAGKFSGFQEIHQHWFVSQEDINTPRYPATIAPFTSEHLGMPEWSSGGPWYRNRATPDWNATAYRMINGSPNCGVACCVLLMNGRQQWNHEPFFRYIIERYYPRHKNQAGGVMPQYSDAIQLIVRDLWDAYVGGSTPAPDPTASAPAFSSPDGKFSGSLEISVSSATPDASIHYTLDGSVPSAASPTYNGPLMLAATTTLKAISVKAGMKNSAVAQATYTLTVDGTSDFWRNIAVESQNKPFVVTFNAVPSGPSIDGVVGVAPRSASDYPHLAGIVRFSPAGAVDVRNGDVYGAARVLSYRGGETYAIRVEVSPQTQRYTVDVTPPGGDAIRLAENFAFRSEHEKSDSISFVSSRVVGGGLLVSDVTVAPLAIKPPRGLRVIR